MFSTVWTLIHLFEVIFLTRMPSPDGPADRTDPHLHLGGEGLPRRPDVGSPVLLDEVQNQAAVLAAIHETPTVFGHVDLKVIIKVAHVDVPA
jgi:hypothetical protein